MTAILDAYNLLANPGNPLNLNPDYVFSHFVPDVMPDGTNKEKVNNSICLLKNIQGIPTNFASNHSRSLETKFQVQIWFNYDDPLAEQYEDLLRKYFEDNNFREYYCLVDKDPALEKLFLTSKFITNQFE